MEETPHLKSAFKSLVLKKDTLLKLRFTSPFPVDMKPKRTSRSQARITLEISFAVCFIWYNGHRIFSRWLPLVIWFSPVFYFKYDRTWNTVNWGRINYLVKIHLALRTKCISTINQNIGVGWKIEPIVSKSQG